jgi:protein-S-isoprenylcysteine O-methyltransferase Ste14
MMKALELRVPPPLLTILIGGAMATVLLGQSTPALSPVFRWVPAALCFIAAGVFAIPAFRAFARARTTINPIAIDQASALVTSGIYRVTRNPMYVALALLLCAWAFFLSRPLAALGPAAFVLFINRFQIIPEERVLTAKFGQAYLDYQQSVRRWL